MGQGDGSPDEPDIRWMEEISDRASRNLLPEGIDTVCRTVWNVKTKYLTAYRASPVLAAPCGKVLTGYRVLEGIEGTAAIAALDFFVREEAVRKLHLLVDSGQKVLLILPVHFSTIEHHNHLVAYLERITALSEEERKLVVFELFAMPRNLLGFRIEDLLARMHHAGRSVMAQVPLDTRSFTPWKEAGIHGVGFDCLDEQVPEKKLMKKMEQFVEPAEKAGIHTFVYGLTTISMATSAVTTGFDYIEGSAVRPSVDTLENIQPFDTEDLLSHLFSQ